MTCDTLTLPPLSAVAASALSEYLAAREAYGAAVQRHGHCHDGTFYRYSNAIRGATNAVRPLYPRSVECEGHVFRWVGFLSVNPCGEWGGL